MKYIVDYAMGRKYRSLIIEAKDRDDLKRKTLIETVRIDNEIAQHYMVRDMNGDLVTHLIFKFGKPKSKLKRGKHGGKRKPRKIYAYDLETMDYVDCYPNSIELATDMDLPLSTIRNKLGLYPEGVRVGTLWLSRKKIKGGSRHD